MELKSTHKSVKRIACLGEPKRMVDKHEATIIAGALVTAPRTVHCPPLTATTGCSFLAKLHLIPLYKYQQGYFCNFSTVPFFRGSIKDETSIPFNSITLNIQHHHQHFVNFHY